MLKWQAMAGRYIHLHVHSHFSLLDGAITVPDLVTAAKQNGMDALALTDHGNLGYWAQTAARLATAVPGSGES